MDYRRRRLGEWLRYHALLLAVSVGIVLLQSQLLPQILGVQLNLLLVAVVAATIINPSLAGALLAFYGGLTLDLLGHTSLGLHGLALLLAVGLTQLILRRLDGENIVLVLLLVAAATLIYHLLTAGLFALLYHPLNWVLFIVAPALVINLIIALPEYLLIRWWSDRRRAW